MCKYSEIALKTFAVKILENLTSKQFYDKYGDEKALTNLYSNDSALKITEKFIKEFDNFGIDGFICDKDKDFPVINDKVNTGEKPYLLFYKGNLGLLNNINNNVAVIGFRNPDENIKKREIKIVESLVNKDLNIVSGLAEGCDTIAHKTTIDNFGKTVAILPSTIQKIIPKSNNYLANDIVKKNGLLITEYFDESDDYYKNIKRFVDRDRLQAMFSKSVVLIASYEKGKGDSGSRHAMEKAKKYGLTRYVMYDENIDCNNLEFKLNKHYLKNFSDVRVFKTSSAKEIYEYSIISFNSNDNKSQQISFNF